MATWNSLASQREVFESVVCSLTDSWCLHVTKNRHPDRHRQAERERETETDKQTEREAERQRGREAERQKGRDWDRERQRQRQPYQGMDSGMSEGKNALGLTGFIPVMKGTAVYKNAKELYSKWPRVLLRGARGKSRHMQILGLGDSAPPLALGLSGFMLLRPNIV